MRLRRIVIDGYGCFSGLELTCVPGLQLVEGPNERGKSTLRAFIADMLYGQSTCANPGQAREEADLRIPWNDPAVYGGRLTYELDDGRVFEVIRSFHQEARTVQVCENGEDITVSLHDEDGEVRIAEEHLGLLKPVFLGTATISHLTLAGLGGEDALGKIREKLLSLADTGDTMRSAQSALRFLEQRIRSIGRPEDTTKPLPAARTRLDALERERLAILDAREAAAEVDIERTELRERELALKREQQALEARVQLVDAHARVRRFETAEELTRRIRETADECRALSGARAFPVARTDELLGLETRVNTARLALERTRTELAETEQALHRIGDMANPAGTVLPQIDDALEDAYAAAGVEVQRLEERLAQLEGERAVAKEQWQAVQAQVGAFPDFSRVAPDPVTWFTQLSSSFDVAQRTRDEECAQRAVVRQEVAQRRERLKPLTALFAEVPDFPGHVRAYEEARYARADAYQQLASRMQTLQNETEEIGERLPGFRFLAGGLGVFFVILLGAFAYFQVPAILLPMGCALLAALYFYINYLYVRRRHDQVRAEMGEVRGEMTSLRSAHPDPADSPVAAMMVREGCESVRELEARYDTFQRQSAELAAQEDVLETVESRADEAEERVAMLLARLRDTFGEVGEEIVSEADVKPAAGRVLARYQEYRECKRRLADSRSRLERSQKEIKALREALAQAHSQADAAAEALRTAMRAAGFAEEREYEAPLAALRAYRQRAAHSRDRHVRREMLSQTRAELEQQVKQEAAALAEHEAALAALLEEADVGSVEEWRTRAGEAARLEELENRRVALEAQRASILDAEELDTLRSEVAALGELPPAPPLSREDLDSSRARLDAEAEDIAARERRLQRRISEIVTAVRPLHEVEEEQALCAAEVQYYTRERDAAAYAMALIEEIARDKHARIAPRLAAIASDHLREITGGAYSQIRIGRDFRIQVCVPDGQRVLEAPEKSLSKGTIDQVYLALRLALVESVSRGQESVPMLLDDPFANYDDERLERTMRLIARIAGRHQVIIFTCRQDVTRAAETLKATVFRL
ncbi:MAG: AAA family ATPase [Candidatus Hydrogenedentota bacterium]